MMISSSSSSCCFVKINPTTFFPKIPAVVNGSTSPSLLHSLSISNSSLLHNNNNNNNNHFRLQQIQPSRRTLLSLTIFLSPFLSPRTSTTTTTWAQTLLELETYTDTDNGFTIRTPASWIKVEKAGATVLFEDPIKGGNNIGVVVTPVRRLNSLREFGDPQFVSNKLIQAEKRKESTKDVEIISSSERQGKNGDLEVYEFEYKLDSTRGGLKRVFSAAFVASKKLYLLNIAYSDNPQNPLDDQTRMVLEQVLHSFDVAPPMNNTQI